MPPKKLIHPLSVLLLAGALSGTLRAVALTNDALSNSIANYVIHVRLDPEEKVITGSENLRWINTSTESIRDLRFHLYLNAFKNSETIFLKESRRRRRKEYLRKPEDWGWIEVDKLMTTGGEDLTNRTVLDETVFSVTLPSPVLPGDSISIDIEFHAKFPKLLARSGYVGDFFMAGQWYPKIGVYLENGWYAHQYSRNSEFFADFGNYDVSISVPETYLVGATGILVDEEEEADGYRAYRYIAKDVHDFAWAASPDFLLADEMIEGIHVLILYQPHHEAGVQRYFDALSAAIPMLREALGPYPYESLTVVDPPAGAFGAMGVEYPTLINVGYFWWMPRGLRFIEEATVHEFGHQYWYGMVANNEVEDPWLDEGLTSYYTARVMEKTYGEGRSFIDLWGLRLGSYDAMRRSCQKSPTMDSITTPSYGYFDNRSYSVNSYSKPGLFLLSMEKLVGSDRWEAIMKSYYNKFRFDHPTAEDFLSHVKTNVPIELHPFIEEVVRGTGTLDYSVAELSVRELQPGKGLFGAPDTAVYIEPHEQAESPTVYLSEVLIERSGDIIIPVEIALRFSAGNQILEVWDGVGRWKRYTFEGTESIEEVRIDPGRKLMLDINPLDNWRSIDYQGQGVIQLTSRILFYLQNMSVLLSSLF